MTASAFAGATGAFGAIGFLVAALTLPDGAWDHPPTVVAAALYAVAWFAAIVVGARSPDVHAGRASAIARLPVVGTGLLWGLGAAVLLAFSHRASLPMVAGLHGVGALLLVAMVFLLRGAGQHMDAVEAELAKTDAPHADLSAALAEARAHLASLGLDAATQQRGRTLFDKAQALPRARLTSPAASAVLAAIQGVSALPDADPTRAAEALTTLERALTRILL
jgi:hypothetical protein